MDDDLRTLAALLDKPGPSAHVYDVGRRKLLDEIRGHVSRQPGVRRGGPDSGLRVTSWVAGIAALAAAMAAVGVVAATLAASHEPARQLASRSARRPSAAQQILLAAAVTARRQQPKRYWQFEERDTFATRIPPPRGAAWFTSQEWITRSTGAAWVWQPPRCNIPGGVVRNGPGTGPSGGVSFTWHVVMHLPTRPAALYAWLARQDRFVVAGPVRPVPLTRRRRLPHYHYVRNGIGAIREDVAAALISLEWEVPASPALRAAAFNALATFPGLKKLGPAEGGEGLLIPFRGEPRYQWIKVIVDPATGQLRSVITSKGTSEIAIARWTNRLPRAVPLGPKSGCGS
jgi:hypothetical protein